MDINEISKSLGIMNGSKEQLQQPASQQAARRYTIQLKIASKSSTK